MEFDLKTLELNNRSTVTAQDSHATMKVESAAKLLPKLGS